MIIFLFIFSIGEITELTIQDSLPIKNESFWEKLVFGVGYSGGLYYTSEYLSPFTYSGLELTVPLYVLHSVEGSIFYQTRREGSPLPRTTDLYPLVRIFLPNKWGVEIGGGYRWAHLSNTERLSMYIPPEEWSDTLSHGYLENSGNWDLSFQNIFLNYNFDRWTVGIVFNLCNAVTEESLYEGYTEYLESAKVSRKCRGFSLGITYSIPTEFITPYFKLELGSAGEYNNNSPWQWEWKEKLSVNLSGIALGLRIDFLKTKF